MKCDVCGGRISRKDTIRPNCWYQLKKRSYTLNNNDLDINKKVMIKKSSIRISGQAILVFLIILIFGIIMFSPKNIEDMKFEEVIEDNRDD